ncbi:MAG: three-Cys-motif partner protein TcmP, partial [Candidatus Hydrogenedentales bacterium]
MRAVVGEWALQKYARVKRYVEIYGGVRQNWYRRGNAGCTYTELYCGPGRVRIEETGEVTHGSPLVAWHESVAVGSPFTQVHVADSDARLVNAAVSRLTNANAPAQVEVGSAAQTVDRVMRKLNPYALHFV